MAGRVSLMQLWRHDALPRIMLKALVAMTFSGWLATLAGWYVTEMGRQPYLVYGVLTTAEAVTSIPAANVAEANPRMHRAVPTPRAQFLVPSA